MDAVKHCLKLDRHVMDDVRLAKLIHERQVDVSEAEVDVSASNEVLHHLLEVSKTSAAVLQNILDSLSDMQQRMHQAEKRLSTVEADQSKTPPPKTSCGFSCSNNSVNIE